MIRGEDVLLKVIKVTGEDEFHEPVLEETWENISNVLIGSPSTDQIVNDLTLHGKKLLFVLGIPKGDAHNWKDAEVKIRGELYKTYGNPLTQTTENTPTPWNTQVKVAMYEQGAIRAE